jgi:hypothetical protein
MAEMGSNEPTTTAVTPSQYEEGSQASSSRAKPEGVPRKQVQLVGAPPVFHGAGRKAEPSRGAESEDEDDQVEEEDDKGQEEGEEKTRVVREGEIADEDLLASLDDDEDVSDGRCFPSRWNH